jgi:hypothetical protein
VIYSGGRHWFDALFQRPFEGPERRPTGQGMMHAND